MIISTGSKNVIISNLDHWTMITNEDITVTGGVYANADAHTDAAPNYGYAGAIATGNGDRTSTITNTTVKIYNSGTSSITDANGNGYAYACTDNESSRAYANSISYSVAG
jgi:hypothetical protein